MGAGWNDAVYYTACGSRGSHMVNSPLHLHTLHGARVVLGGRGGNGDFCGSRGLHLNNSPLILLWYIGARDIIG